ncbi:MAG: AEC family transporter [Halocynthiibacter sp.]
MQALIDVILPVFLLVGAGYVTVWRNYFDHSVIDGIMKYAQNFAIPVLLFRAISQLNLGQNFDAHLLISFYTGAVAGFTLGLLGGRFLFGRDWEDSVAIGFVGLFSNSLLLGVAITERAYGPDALEANFAIVSIHAPFCYALGISVMEFIRGKGTGLRATATSVIRAMFKNALVVAIMLGIFVNLSGIIVPNAAGVALDLIKQSALPAALFGLGGVLYRYRPDGDIKIIAYLCLLSLIIHPAITWGLGRFFNLPEDAFRSAVLTAAMAPGINTYLFANMYGKATRVAASTVLIATALTIITAWGWITLLGT